jgi:hypothetical protein
MGDPLFLVALTGLSLSALVSAFRMIEWFMRSDPKVIAQTGRWAAVGLAVAAVPVLIGLLVGEQWTAATGLAAVMLLGFALYGPRLVRSIFPRRLRPDWSFPAGAWGQTPGNGAMSEQEMVQRSIAVLEEYLRRTTGIAEGNASDRPALPPRNGAARHGNGSGHRHAGMSRMEAWEVLGLTEGASEQQINEAHARLTQLVDPERGGSNYLMLKINEAKDLLLAEAHASDGSPPRKPARRRAPRPPA